MIVENMALKYINIIPSITLFHKTMFCNKLPYSYTKVIYL